MKPGRIRSYPKAGCPSVGGIPPSVEFFAAARQSAPGRSGKRRGYDQRHRPGRCDKITNSRGSIYKIGQRASQRPPFSQSRKGERFGQIFYCEAIKKDQYKYRLYFKALWQNCQGFYTDLRQEITCAARKEKNLFPPGRAG